MQQFKTKLSQNLGSKALSSGKTLNELTASQSVRLYSTAAFHSFPKVTLVANHGLQKYTKQVRLVTRSYATASGEDDDGDPGLLLGKFMRSYWKTKQSLAQSDKDDHVTKAIPRFLGQFSKHRPISVGVVADMLITASYIPVSRQSSFTIKLPKDGSVLFSGIAGHDDVTFQLIDGFTQRLLPSDLAVLPWDVQPGTAVQIWNATCKSTTRKVAVFRGTNSVGSSRDALLGHLDATGALANGAAGEIGANVIAHWLTLHGHPLAKHLKTIDAVIGHSLGAALAQDYCETILKTTGKPPLGYFASSPGRGRPPLSLWTEHADRFFFTKSAHDFVPRSGIYDWPGNELRFDLLDAPIVPGLVDKWADRWLIQHGSLLSAMKTIKCGELIWKPRKGTQLSTASSPLDEVDVGPFGYEIVDLLRPGLTRYLFTPTLIETIMRQIDDYQLGASFGKGVHAQRGLPYGAFVHLAAEFMGSELFCASSLFHPEPTLRILLSSYNDLVRKDDTDQVITRVLERALDLDSDLPLPVTGDNNGQWRERVKQLIRDTRKSFQQNGIVAVSDKDVI